MKSASCLSDCAVMTSWVMHRLTHSYAGARLLDNPIQGISLLGTSSSPSKACIYESPALNTALIESGASFVRSASVCVPPSLCLNCSYRFLRVYATLCYLHSSSCTYLFFDVSVQDLLKPVLAAEDPLEAFRLAGTSASFFQRPFFR